MLSECGSGKESSIGWDTGTGGSVSVSVMMLICSVENSEIVGLA